ncbi:MAG: YegS/Rv2252/BmrU family lipid kinase [Firmicutes bacterium]|nr:YegS/Rv2252/BmrU family lipid kinase [Bacillota bacterium]
MNSEKITHHLIVNPVAGKGKGKKALKKLEKLLKKQSLDYVIHQTTKAGDATLFAEQLTATNTQLSLIVVGGDGTFSEVLNGIINFDNITLGLIPSGTGNDFAFGLGISKKVRRALAPILAGNKKYIDYIQTDTRRSLNILGTGLDVEVLTRFNSYKRQTKIAYFKSLISTLRNLSYKEYIVKYVDEFGQAGELPPTPTLALAVCNGTMFGGGMKMSPLSVVDDGLLDLVHAAKPDGNILIAANRLKKGKHLSYPYITHIRVREIYIRPLDESQPFIFQIEGEIISNQNSVSAKVVSGQLKIYY